MAWHAHTHSDFENCLTCAAFYSSAALEVRHAESAWQIEIGHAVDGSSSTRMELHQNKERARRTTEASVKSCRFNSTCMRAMAVLHGCMWQDLDIGVNERQRLCLGARSVIDSFDF